MGQLVALPLVCSLGVADACPGALVAWPAGVVSPEGEPICDVEVALRYEEGIVAQVVLTPAGGYDDDSWTAALEERVRSWEGSVAAGKAQAGPLSPVLGELFDRMALMGGEVEALLPDGQAFAHGVLSGLTVWGRVVLVIDGRELELSPEQASLRAAV